MRLLLELLSISIIYYTVVETNYPIPASLPTSSQGRRVFLTMQKCQKTGVSRRIRAGPLFKSKTGPGYRLDPSRRPKSSKLFTEMNTRKTNCFSILFCSTPFFHIGFFYFTLVFLIFPFCFLIFVYRILLS